MSVETQTGAVLACGGPSKRVWETLKQACESLKQRAARLKRAWEPLKRRVASLKQKDTRLKHAWEALKHAWEALKHAWEPSKREGEEGKRGAGGARVRRCCWRGAGGRGYKGRGFIVRESHNNASVADDMVTRGHFHSRPIPVGVSHGKQLCIGRDYITTSNLRLEEARSSTNCLAMAQESAFGISEMSILFVISGCVATASRTKPSIPRIGTPYSLQTRIMSRASLGARKRMPPRRMPRDSNCDRI